MHAGPLQDDAHAAHQQPSHPLLAWVALPLHRSVFPRRWSEAASATASWRLALLSSLQPLAQVKQLLDALRRQVAARDAQLSQLGQVAAAAAAAVRMPGTVATSSGVRVASQLVGSGSVSEAAPDMARRLAAAWQQHWPSPVSVRAGAGGVGCAVRAAYETRAVLLEALRTAQTAGSDGRRVSGRSDYVAPACARFRHLSPCCPSACAYM